MPLVTRLFPVAAAGLSLAILSACGGQSGIGPGIPGSSSAQSHRLNRPLSIERASQRIRELVREGRGPGAVPAHGGAGYPVTAAPRLKVPNEAPCVDVLFTPHTPPLQYGACRSAILPITATIRLTIRRLPTAPDPTPKSFSRFIST